MGMLLNQNISLSNIATGIIPPITNGLEFYNLYNDASKLGRNFATGKPQATIVGSPAFNGESITCTNLGNYINTNVPQTQEMTILTIGQPTAVNGNFVHWSNYGSPITNGGTGLTSADFLRQSVSTGNPSLSLSYSDDSFCHQENTVLWHFIRRGHYQAQGVCNGVQSGGNDYACQGFNQC
ncbi:Uncharacterised protein [Raoultella terrigena]|uniref:hypothetical protein n=1 Tax=Raoultella terrigena TaxID=577 RepID=UPI0011647C2B|nr:hypothetical protein [Raoultella terrigena]VUC80010.1 Uncharacterised protein [Raoultella terrigena]